MKEVRFMLIAMVLVFAASCLWAAPAKETKGPQAQWWGKAPGPKPVANGTVASVSATNIAVQTKEGVKNFTVDAKTNVRIRGQKATIADVKVGDPVIVHFKLVPNNVPLALGILVPKPGLAGEITAIQGNVITIRERIRQPRGAGAGAAGRRVKGAKPETQRYTLGPEHQITVTDTTKYRSHGYVGSLADLRIGYLITAQGTVTEQGLTADGIQFVPALARGTVTAVNGNAITVKTVRQLELSLEASPATVVLIRPRVGPNQKGTLADIKVGMPADVGFHPVQTGPAPLLWIDLLTGM